MRKIIVLFLAFSVLSLSVNLMAKERRGADLIIKKKDGQQVRGELIVVKQNSFLLKESISGADVTVDVSDIKKITIVKKSKALMRGGMGLLIGGAVGVAAGYAFVYTRTLTLSAWQEEPKRIYSEYALAFGLIGSIIGALVGGITGAVRGNDETLQIEGKSNTNIKETLEELRKKARVPNFQ